MTYSEIKKRHIKEALMNGTTHQEITKKYGVTYRSMLYWFPEAIEASMIHKRMRKYKKWKLPNMRKWCAEHPECSLNRLAQALKITTANGRVLLIYRMEHPWLWDEEAYRRMARITGMSIEEVKYHEVPFPEPAKKKSKDQLWEDGELNP